MKLCGIFSLEIRNVLFPGIKSQLRLSFFQLLFRKCNVMTDFADGIRM